MVKHLDSYDEQNFDTDNKEQKRNKKALEKRDRSKFKKSDQEEKKIFPSSTTSLKGRVISVESEGALVFEETEQKLYSCAVKGSLKYAVTKEKNLLTIGDFVLFECLPQNQGQIFQILPRISTLYRADNFHRRKMQLIAANIDQVLITISCVEPTLKTALIDRYLIAALRGNLHPVILITKIDLIESEPPLLEWIESVKATYTSLGYQVVLISTVSMEGIKELDELLKKRSSVFSGQSGVGKTSLINLITGKSFKTREVINKTMKGAHTTTKAHLIPLDCGGFCVDTPGIRSFGMWDLKKEDIQEYFPEIAEKRKDCKYTNCRHQEEPGCAVKLSAEEGEIAFFRYESYLNLMAEETPLDY